MLFYSAATNTHISYGAICTTVVRKLCKLEIGVRLPVAPPILTRFAESSVGEQALQWLLRGATRGYRSTAGHEYGILEIRVRFPIAPPI